MTRFSRFRHASNVRSTMPAVETEVKLDFKDVLIRPKKTSVANGYLVSVERSFTFVNSEQTLNCVPIVAANMDSIATFEVAEVLAKRKVMVAIHKNYTVEQWKAWAAKSKEVLPYIAVSTGIFSHNTAKTAEILTAVPEVSMICIHVANGYSEWLVKCIRDVRSKYPTKTIMAGNVVTKEMTEELILSGADIIKVGIGAGSVDTTRTQTGVGYPQLSAVLECADAAHGLGGRVISDGGCTCPGDVAKAFGAGADFVMLGGMLAGHDECAGDAVEERGEYFKDFCSTEGKTVRVPYRGPIDDTIKDILGGVRAACTYVGASTVEEMSKRTTFIRVTQQLNTTSGTVFTESKVDSDEDDGWAVCDGEYFKSYDASGELVKKKKVSTRR